MYVLLLWHNKNYDALTLRNDTRGMTQTEIEINYRILMMYVKPPIDIKNISKHRPHRPGICPTCCFFTRNYFRGLMCLHEANVRQVYEREARVVILDRQLQMSGPRWILEYKRLFSNSNLKLKVLNSRKWQFGVTSKYISSLKMRCIPIWI